MSRPERADEEMPQAGPSSHSLLDQQYQPPQPFQPPQEQNYPYRFFPLSSELPELEIAFQSSGAGITQNQPPNQSRAAAETRGSSKRAPRTRAINSDAIKSWSQAVPTTFSSTPGMSAWPPRSNPIPIPISTSDAAPTTAASAQRGARRGSGYRVVPPLALSRASSLPPGVGDGEGGEGRMSDDVEARRQENRIAERDFVARAEANFQYSDQAPTRSSSDNPSEQIAHLEAEARAQEAKIREQNMMIISLKAENDLLRKASATLSRRGSSRPTAPSRGGSRTTSTGTGLTGTGTGSTGQNSSLATGVMSQPHSMDKNAGEGGADPVAALERFLAKRKGKRERDSAGEEEGKSAKSKTSATPKNTEQV